MVVLIVVALTIAASLAFGIAYVVRLMLLHSLTILQVIRRVPEDHQVECSAGSM